MKKKIISRIMAGVGIIGFLWYIEEFYKLILLLICILLICFFVPMFLNS